jgi:YesN/AraC family two-component response regulator
MPVVDGMETLRRMRKAGNDVAVVIVTAHGSIPDAVAAMKLGAVDFLAKPVTPDALRRVVADVVSRHAKPKPEPQPKETGHPAARKTPEPKFFDYKSVTALVAPSVVDLSEIKRAINQRDLKRAERLLEEVLDKAPDSPEALTISGVLHECMGEAHAAYQAYRHALECDRRYRPALENLKRYCERHGLDFNSKAINPSA